MDTHESLLNKALPFLIILKDKLADEIVDDSAYDAGGNNYLIKEVEFLTSSILTLQGKK